MVKVVEDIEEIEVKGGSRKALFVNPVHHSDCGLEAKVDVDPTRSRSLSFPGLPSTLSLTHNGH